MTTPHDDTMDLLRRAFPSGADGPELEAIAAVLGEHMSLRNLGAALDALSEGGAAMGYHTAIRAASGQLSVAPELGDSVRRRLVLAGLEAWIAAS